MMLRNPYDDEMNATVADAKTWAERNAALLEAYRLNSTDPDVIAFNKVAGNLAREIWHSGTWLDLELEALGANADARGRICFAHGQRCFIFDPWEIAVAYRNQYARSGQIPEEPGRLLARRINEGEPFDASRHRGPTSLGGGGS